MRQRCIDATDVEAVLTSPEKISGGNHGMTNYYGMGITGYRLRVTISPDGSTVVTVAWADRRMPRSFRK